MHFFRIARCILFTGIHRVICKNTSICSWWATLWVFSGFQFCISVSPQNIEKSRANQLSIVHQPRKWDRKNIGFVPQKHFIGPALAIQRFQPMHAFPMHKHFPVTLQPLPRLFRLFLQVLPNLGSSGRVASQDVLLNFLC